MSELYDKDVRLGHNLVKRVQDADASGCMVKQFSLVTVSAGY